MNAPIGVRELRADLAALVRESFTKGRMDNNLVDLSQADVRAILEAAL